MQQDTISSIDPPGSLRRLLEEKEMRNCVIVSEVHRCSSYARLLTDKSGGTISLGLSVETPTASAASAGAEGRWVCSSHSGNFKWKSTKSREFNPLFRLVSLREEATSTGFRGAEGGDPPLPDAVPPWMGVYTEAEAGGVSDDAAK